MTTIEDNAPKPLLLQRKCLDAKSEQQKWFLNAKN
jgi:hypothetical protein